MKSKICIILTLLLLMTCGFAADNSGANAPEVYQGLYPIKLNADGSVNVNADGKITILSASNPEWYNYNEGKWANAVTLDEVGRMNPSIATEANITGYYVWIPRYAYLIRTGYNTSDTGRIDIRFLKGNTNQDNDGITYYTIDNLENTAPNWEEINGVTYIGDRQMEYLVHPAFKFQEELTGIWVGKSEASKEMVGEIERVNTIPNEVLWQGLDIASGFEETRNMVSKSGAYDIYNLYGFGENVNTHLIKATEYGAAVYLTNSKYGENSATVAYRINGLNDIAEYMAAYLEGTKDIGQMGALGDEYKDVYTKDELENIVDVKGSAFLETSNGTAAWDSGTTENINETNGVVVKNDAYGIKASNGKDNNVGFRVVITKGTNENKVKEMFASANNKSYWWLMENGDVWTMGENSSGQLGLGGTEYKYIPEKIKLDSTGNALPPIKKIINDGKIILIDVNGYMYMIKDKKPTMVKDGNENPLVGIAKIINKGDSTFYLTDNGELYVYGNNKYNQLGIESTSGEYEDPDGGYGWYGIVDKVTKVERDSDGNAVTGIVEVFGDGESMYFLTKDGEVYVTGKNDLAQLGVNSTSSFYDEYYGNVPIVNELTKLTNDSEGNPIIGIDKIVINDGAIYYINNNGEVYVNGCNEYNRLGMNKTSSKYDDYYGVDTPVVDKVTKLKDNNGSPVIGVMDIMFSGNSTYFLTEVEELGKGVYVAGENQGGQLGVASTGSIYDDTWSEIPIVEKATKISVDGKGNALPNFKEIITGESMYCIGENGELYVSGYNEYGDLGIDSTEEIYVGYEGTPKRIVKTLTKVEVDDKGNAIPEIDKIIRVVYWEDTHTWFIGRNGELYVSGRNDYGELGVPSTGVGRINYGWEEVPIVSKMTRVDKDSAGNALPPIVNVTYSSGTAYYTANNGNVYAAGSLNNGQTGLVYLRTETNTQTTETNTQTTATEKPADIINIQVNRNEIKQIISGKLYLTNAGEVYKNGIKIKKDSDGDVLAKIEKMVNKGTNGIYTTYCIGENGELYVCETNVSGITRVKVDSNAEVVAPIKDITIVNNESVYFIGTEGELYVYGENSGGQFGLGNNYGVYTITRVKTDVENNVLPAIDKVVGLKDGSNYSTWYIAKNGDVYACGSNANGRLGINSNDSSVNKLTNLNLINNVYTDFVNVIAGCKGNIYYLGAWGELYVSGRNGNYQLGISGGNVIKAMTRVDRDIMWNSLPNIKNVVTNGFSTWFITDYDKLYVSGDTDTGIIGMEGEGDPNYVDRLTSISRDSDGNQLPYIKDVIVYNGSAWYLGENGEVYVSGTTLFGQLGVASTAWTDSDGELYVDKITRITVDKDGNTFPAIDKIIVDDNSVWYLGVNGEVYVSGSNDYSQLGVTSTTMDECWQYHYAECRVRKVTEDSKGRALPAIKEIIVYDHSAWYIGVDGELYVSGNNPSDRLGVESTSTEQLNCYEPTVGVITKVETDNMGQALLPIINVIPEATRAYYIDENYNVYVCGNNSSNTLGLGTTVSSVNRLSRMRATDDSYSTLGNITSIYGNATSTVFEEDDGDIFVIGDNTNKKLGTNGEVDVATKINIKNVKDVGIGSDFSVFLKDDGSVVGYGNSSKNGSGLTNIAQIAVGENHAVFLTKDGQIINRGAIAFVSGVNNIHKIVAGANHTVVLMKDGLTEEFGQAIDPGFNIELEKVVDVFAGKNMTVYIMNDGKAYLMEGDVKTELPMKNIVYAELNGEQPYFVTYDRNLVDKDGNIISALGTEMTWVKEVKGDVVLTERMRTYDLSKL